MNSYKKAKLNLPLPPMHKGIKHLVRTLTKLGIESAHHPWNSLGWRYEYVEKMYLLKKARQ